jgi:hypothetical protein
MSLEGVRPSQPLEAAQPTTSPRMEQVVTHLAAHHNIDFSQKGATLTLDVPEQKQQWRIGTIDSQRVGVTRLQVDQESGLAPDLDMVFEITPAGWEPVEIVHTDSVWDEYTKAAEADGRPVTDPVGNFAYATFTDYIAQQVPQHEGLEPVRKTQEQGTQPLGKEAIIFPPQVEASQVLEQGEPPVLPEVISQFVQREVEELGRKWWQKRVRKKNKGEQRREDEILTGLRYLDKLYPGLLKRALIDEVKKKYEEMHHFTKRDDEILEELAHLDTLCPGVWDTGLHERLEAEEQRRQHREAARKSKPRRKPRSAR